MIEIVKYIVDSLKSEPTLVKVLAWGALLVFSLCVFGEMCGNILRIVMTMAKAAAIVTQPITAAMKQRTRISTALCIGIVAVMLAVECSSSGPLTRSSVALIALFVGLLIVLTLYLAAEIAFAMAVKRVRKEAGM